MIYFLLILFFGSLISISIMLGRKLVLLRKGEISERQTTMSEVSHLDEWKNLGLEKIKKYGYEGLVGTIRLYVRLMNYVSKKQAEIKLKLKERSERRMQARGALKPKPNHFLKIISESKHKIRKIKHQIKEEEDNSL